MNDLCSLLYANALSLRQGFKYKAYREPIQLRIGRCSVIGSARMFGSWPALHKKSDIQSA